MDWIIGVFLGSYREFYTQDTMHTHLVNPEMYPGCLLTTTAREYSARDGCVCSARALWFGQEDGWIRCNVHMMPRFLIVLIRALPRVRPYIYRDFHTRVIK